MRATVDLDDPVDLDIVRAWYTMRDYGDGRVLGRVSSSGDGVHLKVHGCDESEVMSVRRLCGDDPKRVQFDENTDLKPKQILFASKPTGEAGEWTDDLDRVLAEYRRRASPGVRHPDGLGGRWP